MKIPDPRTYPVWVQHVISVGMVLLVSGIGFSFTEMAGVKIVALLLLVTVAFLALLFQAAPVLVAAILSALAFNYFFIPPIGSFMIGNPRDVPFYLLFCLLTAINILLTFRVRKIEKRERERAEQDHLLKLYQTLLNSLSHELRTPVSSIIGALDTLRENRETLSEEDRAELLSVIERAGWRLDREVENLLNMSRLESGMLKLHYDWCDPAEVIFRAVRKLPREDSRSVSFTPPEQDLPLLRMDAGILEQVVYNLLHNAMQHTPENTSVTVTAEYGPGNLSVTVSDNGPGFPEAEIPRVFDKFYRIHASKPGGSGLGLSIVKGFTEAMQGKVVLENNAGGGARITVNIPAETTTVQLPKNEQQA